MAKRADLQFKQIGRLFAIHSYSVKEVKRPGTARYWYCICECGKTKIISATRLNYGDIKSCGCLQKEKSKLATLKRNEKQKYFGGFRLLRGNSAQSEFESWRGMKERCDNKKSINYKYYGAKGVKICKRWYSFKNFLKDMGLKPDTRYTIDRIDPYGNYTHGNCRWATRFQQRHNRREKELCPERPENCLIGAKKPSDTDEVYTEATLKIVNPKMGWFRRRK